MERSDVAAYVERSTSLIESSPQMNEGNTKAKLIRPLIELLGWNIYSGDVELEYSMQIGRGNTRADYALLLEGTPVVFIEAKGCDTGLSDAARTQLTSYMRQTGVDWGLLTNRKTFEILKRRTESERPDEVTIGTPSLEELADEYELLELLSKDLVASGEADRIAARMEATKRAIERLRTDKERIAERVTDVITDELENVPPQEIQTVSKEYIDNLIDSLGSNRETSLKAPDKHRTRAESLPEQPSGQSQTDGKMTVDDGDYMATIYDGETALQSFSEETQTALMAAVTDFLITEYELVDEIGPLPYVPGRKNAVLNTEPHHPSGEEMRLYEAVSDNLFLHTALNKQSKERHLRKFAKSCGFGINFTEK